jgi:hypothetical protein
MNTFKLAQILCQLFTLVNFGLLRVLKVNENTLPTEVNRVFRETLLVARLATATAARWAIVPATLAVATEVATTWSTVITATTTTVATAIAATKVEHVGHRRWSDWARELLKQL